MRPTASKKNKENRNSSISNFELLETRELMAADILGAMPDVFVNPDLATPQVINLPTQQVSESSTNANAALHDTFGLTGLGQTVVVIDSGVAYDHFALGGGFGEEYRVVGGFDFAERDADPYDDAPGGLHGTQTTGVIASSDSTYTGVAPGVDIVSLRVFDDNGGGSFTWIESALDWVHDHKDDFENPITTVNLSIGATWNSDTIPPWAQLEEELQILEDDGIFISVSAGNGFRTSQTTGLSYPAASPFVVPVGSVNSAGNLSSFSQRSERVLLAPGELITSTAPDYINGFDGVTDDFARTSGTSVSAPYVAGASVLVRQALEIAGVNNITQDTIYEHLRETADEVYDSVTDQTYLQVNLGRALELALPEDLVGDTLETARNLGDVSSIGTVDGWINSAVDSDIYTFEASESGTVRIVSDNLPEGFQISRLGGAESGDDFSFDVVAGEEYSVQVEGNTPGEFQSRFEFTAAPPVVTPPTSGPTDPAVPSDGADDLVVDLTGATHIAATENADRIDIWTGFTTEIQINGERHELTAEQAENIVIDGASAEDVITIHGTSANETAVVRDDQASIRGDGYSVTVHGAKRLNVNSGGGEDSVVVYDGVGDDLLIAREDFTILMGAEGRNHRVNGFDDVQVVADAGGRDVAILHDSANDDFFRFSYESATMQYDEDNAGARVQVDGFERIVGIAGQGGTDRAEAHGSSEAHRFVSRQNASYLTGFRESHRAEGFDHVDAYAADNNVAWVYDTPEDDHLLVTSEKLELRGGYSVNAYGYDDIGALGNGGGVDTAIIRDSFGDDTFKSFDGLAVQSGDDYRHVIQGYERVTAVSLFGDDTAIFYGSRSQTDDLNVNGVVHQVVNPTRDHSAMGFGEVELRGSLAELEAANPAPLALSADLGADLALNAELNAGVVVAAADPTLALQPRMLESNQVDHAVVREESALEPIALEADSSDTLTQQPVEALDVALQQPIERQSQIVDDAVATDDQGADEIAAVWENFGDFN